MTEPSTMPGGATGQSTQHALNQDAELAGFSTTEFETAEFETAEFDVTEFEIGEFEIGDPGTADARPIAPPTKREREAAWMRAALEVQDLTEMPIEELRVLADRMFRLLDSARPPLDADERYTAAVTEIEARARQQAARTLGDRHRQVFKDSAFGSRLELFLDGSLAAYIRYTLVGSRLTLRIFVESPGFEGRGLAPVLMRHAMLHAHKRRLSVIPGCAAAHTFLEQNPQYRALARLAH